MKEVAIEYRVEKADKGNRIVRLEQGKVGEPLRLPPHHTNTPENLEIALAWEETKDRTRAEREGIRITHKRTGQPKPTGKEKV